MLKNTLGIVNIEGTNVNFDTIMGHRAPQAFSFLARYRLIDFVLSNMSNSGITEYQVYMPDNLRSTIQHVGTGKQYNINSKFGKFRLLSANPTSSAVFQTDIKAFKDNLRFIENSTKEYVLIAPSYIVYNQDYRKMMEAHLASKADISVLYKNATNAQDHFIGATTIRFGDNKRIVAFEENHGHYRNRTVSLEAYIMKRSKLLELIKRSEEISSLFWLKDILNDKDILRENKIMGVAHSSYVACINNKKAYYQTQLELNDSNNRSLLFKPDWPINTKTSDTSPTLYGPLAEVKGSLIANGCYINGQIENSVIDRDVVIEDGVTIKNSIILNNVRIVSGTHIENAIIDKDVRINRGVDLLGSPDLPEYVEVGKVL